MAPYVLRPIIAVLLAASTACSHPSAAPAPAPERSGHSAGSAAAAGTTASSAATSDGASGSAGVVDRVRADSLRRPWTEADVRFMTDMIGHHAQALLISAWVPTHGADASIVRLAERIINAQQDEIATMRTWLSDRGRPVREAGDSAHAAMHHDGHAMAMPGMMPGMLSPAQLAELDAARGPAFDRLFLTGMIQHHRGAVTMVQQLFATPGAARDETVFKFANDVSADQSTEIARMETMLAALTTERSAP